MKFKSVLAAATIVTSIPLATVTVSATEIISNGGFETGSLTPWVSSDNGWTVTDATSYGGTYSAVSGGNYGLVQSLDYVLTTSINDISFAASTNSMVIVFRYLAFSNWGASLTSSETVIYGENSWKNYNINSSLYRGNVLNGYLLYSIGFYGTGYLDNVSVTTGPIFAGVPETSTWVMMLAGFAGLGFAGYRRNKGAQLAA
jgi:hypothetical protein